MFCFYFVENFGKIIIYWENMNLLIRGNFGWKWINMKFGFYYIDLIEI